MILLKRKNKKGVVLVTVIVISMLMAFIGMSASNMLLQDMHMVRRLKHSNEAQYLAESGISVALATLASSFSAKDNPANFPQTDLGNGTYDVTVSESEGRVLLSSEGVARGVSRTVALEVKDNTVEALNYMMSSGADFQIFAMNSGLANIKGNMHGNNLMALMAIWDGVISINPCGEVCCNGSVSASGPLYLVEIEGGVITFQQPPTRGVPTVAFPTFDYVHYKNLASAGGGRNTDYFSGNKTWRDEEIRPVNGIVYVEGRATFRGTCHLYGGIVADEISINGKLYQHRSGTRNVIVSRTGNIEVWHELEAEQALVCAGQDFGMVSSNNVLNLTGTIIAKRYFTIVEPGSPVTYQHLSFNPDGILDPNGMDNPLIVVSWND